MIYFPHLGADRGHHSAPDECSGEGGDQVGVEEGEGRPGELTTDVQVTMEEAPAWEELATQA